MKELSIEQKAKRYDEAIKRAKDFMNGEAHYELKIGENIMCWVFPELRESEDERMRKALIDYFRWNPHGQLLNEFSNKEVFSWLEKQGEQKPILDVEIPFGTDSELVEEAITIQDGCYAIIEDNKVILRKGEKKSSWSKKDEAMLNFVMIVLNKHKNDEFFDEFKTTLSDCLSWFRDTKSRVGCEASCTTKQEWSKEDEKAINDIMWIIEAYRENGFNDIHKQMANNAEKWLKSLRPQSKWKPSEEQLIALKCAITTADEKWVCMNTKDLESLYEQLKKLREE